MTNDRVKFFVSCAPGIESVLEEECRRIHLIPIHQEQKQALQGKDLVGEDTGGILFEGTYAHMMRCNLHLRTASRVVVRLGEFYAVAFAELRKKAARLEWEKYLYPGQRLNIRAACHKSKLYHSDGVAERVLGAINDHFTIENKKVCTQDPTGQLILVRMVNDLCTISIDSSGELLHKRGYRQAVAKAPLRETLAAAMLLSSAWDGESILVDPFCGSGTIPIEAALICRSIPPGINRSFAFAKWPVFNPGDWEELLQKGKESFLPAKSRIIGYDRDTGAIEMASANASRAGQKEVIEFKQQAISFLEPPSDHGLIICNPPYGVRVSGNKDLRDLYARFGEIMKANFSGWTKAILTNDKVLAGNLNMGAPGKLLRFTNGGIPVQFDIYSPGIKK